MPIWFLAGLGWFRRLLAGGAWAGILACGMRRLRETPTTLCQHRPMASVWSGFTIDCLDRERKRRLFTAGH
jgi:hypothetical protein